MTRVVKSFSVPVEKLNLLEELDTIARRDGAKLGVKNTSELIVKIIEEFVKSHKVGNIYFTLDPWAERQDFHAYPAFDADWSQVPEERYSDKDLHHIANKAREILAWAERAGRKRDILV